MNPPRKTINLEDYVPYFLEAIGNPVSRGASRLYLDTFGVGIIDWRVMVTLAAHANVTAAEIGESVRLDKAAVSRSLHVLEHGGYIRVSSGEDTRARIHALTDAGWRLHDRILAVAQQREQRLLDGMSPEDIQTLLGLLRRLRTNIASLNSGGYDVPE